MENADSMISLANFTREVTDLVETINNRQMKNISQVAKIIAKSLQEDGLLHVFSTGHSHMVVEELFYRAGGLVQVNPILETSLMLHEGAVKSTKLERLSGYAAAILAGENVEKGEVIIIASNSGINCVPIEMALLAKEKGLSVVAITSLEASKQLVSRHSSGKKLYEVSDFVIDNCVPKGDAAATIPNTTQSVGALSSIAYTYIAQSLVLNIVNGFIEKGMVPPVYMSANMPGGDVHNNDLINKYKGRIRCLH